jgi:hypothetical protein
MTSNLNPCSADHWTANGQSKSDWQRDCHLAATDADAFARFRQLSGVVQMTEGRSATWAKEWLADAGRICPRLLSLCEAFVACDAIGSPNSFDFPSWGKLSPAAAVYIATVARAEHLFGSMSGWVVAEIGGGYGGLCAAFQVAVALKNYTIYDLPEAGELQRAYIGKLGVGSAVLHTASEIPDRLYDLILSDCAFSELDAEAQSDYARRVVACSAHGLMGMNYLGSDISVHTAALKRVRDALAPRELKQYAPDGHWWYW